MSIRRLIFWAYVGVLWALCFLTIANQVALSYGVDLFTP